VILRPIELCFPVETARQEVHNSQAIVGSTLERAETETPLEYDRGKETILVVDDEESLRTVIVDLLGHLGYCTLSAANGHDALELARRYPGKIDLLLTDVAMHPLTGPALAEKLMRSRPAMKVIYISGYANASLAPDGVLKPGTVLVHKPFTMKILSAKLREVLGNPTTA
jgi:two-component system, cell cycle sensor histidine kinase and response regulator CckA